MRDLEHQRLMRSANVSPTPDQSYLEGKKNKDSEIGNHLFNGRPSTGNTI